MKKYMFIPLMYLVLMSSTCNNENNKHFYVTIQNQSDNDVDMCSLFTNIESQCTLIPLSVIEKNSVFEWQPFPRYSIEQGLSGKWGSGILEFYLVNNRQPQGGFYDCDSIPIKNDILKHYKLTLADLQQMNWTVVYPPEE